MTTRRAVTYGGLICLLAAWLASAASTSWNHQEPPAQPAGTSGSPEALVADVQAHAAKLRARLASARGPQAPHRNPFAFESRPVPVPRPAAPRDPAPPPAPPPAEPVLSLIGVAEDNGPKGITRTAVLTDDTDAVIMATVGQTVLGRYRVEAIGADAVELKDVNTGAIRRLALR